LHCTHTIDNVAKRCVLKAQSAIFRRAHAIKFTLKNVKCVHKIKCVEVRELFAKNEVGFARAKQLVYGLQGRKFIDVVVVEWLFSAELTGWTVTGLF